METTLYLVGENEDDALGNLPFDSIDSAESYARDNSGTFVYVVFRRDNHVNHQESDLRRVRVFLTHPNCDRNEIEEFHDVEVISSNGYGMGVITESGTESFFNLSGPGWHRRIEEITVKYMQPGQSIWSHDSVWKGVPTGGEHPCRMEGCNGVRISTRWPNGKLTYPCSKGLISFGPPRLNPNNPDEPFLPGDLKIG